MQNKLISVIVPVYNVEDYLKECVDSILAQTYSPIEIILVDDGSTDASGEVCEEYARSHEIITVYHKPNGGLSSARNYGIERANGELLSFIDSDDYIAPDMLAVLYADMTEYEADVAVCSCYRLYSNGRVEESMPKYEKFTLLQAEKSLCLYDDFSAWNKLYKKSLFQDIRYPEGKLYEDARTTYRVMMLAKAATYNPRPLYYYRQRATSIMGTFQPDKYLDRVHVWDELIAALQDSFSQEQVAEMKRRKNHLVMELILSTMLQKNYRGKWSMLRQLAAELQQDELHRKDYTGKELLAAYMALVLGEL